MFILAPYLDLDKIAESGQCFRWKKTGHRAYQISAFGKTLNARHTAVPDEVELDCSPQDYYGTWARYFDLEADYEQYERELKTRSDTGAYLLAAARAAKGIRILKQELWETILSFIISQNNNIPRIKGCIERLCERFGGFPGAGTIAKHGPKGLDGLGLGYRQDYIIDAAITYHGDGDGSMERILRDPTPGEAMSNIRKEQRQQEAAERLALISRLIPVMKQTAELAGFEVVGRITLKDKETGKEYR